MYTNLQGNPPSASPTPILRGASSLAVLAMGIGWVVPVFSQTSPNWGAVSPQTRPGLPATTSPSPWGGTSAATPPQPRHSGLPAAKPEPIPRALAEILERPETDVIRLTNGQTKTVKEIRAEVSARQAIIGALKSGNTPPGSKRVRLAVSRSPQHDELLNASKSMRDTARREATSATATPDAASPSHAMKGAPASPWASSEAQGQADSNAFAKASPTRNIHSTQRLGTAPGVPIDATTLHSGIGSSSMRQSTEASAPSAKPGLLGVSQQPAQVAVAQSIPAGIAIVNGHSKGVQFTPGGLYSIVGSGFGGTVGAVDLIGPHLPGGRLSLPVTQWSDRQLRAELPEPLSGVADQLVTLRVTTRTGTLYTMDVQFYATRQPITLSGSDLDLGQVFDLSLGAPNDWSATLTNSGSITRTKSGNNIDCPSIGKDSLRTRFPPGWALVEVTINSWLPAQGSSNKDFFGQDGDTIVSGSYNITQIPAGLTNQTFEVNWGVLRSHSTNGLSLIPKFTGNDFGWTGNDGCVSSYNLEVTLVGPAGTRPF